MSGKEMMVGAEAGTNRIGQTEENRSQLEIVERHERLSIEKQKAIIDDAISKIKLAQADKKEWQGDFTTQPHFLPDHLNEILKRCGITEARFNTYGLFKPLTDKSNIKSNSQVVEVDLNLMIESEVFTNTPTRSRDLDGVFRFSEKDALDTLKSIFEHAKIKFQPVQMKPTFL